MFLFIFSPAPSVSVTQTPGPRNGRPSPSLTTAVHSRGHPSSSDAVGGGGCRVLETHDEATKRVHATGIAYTIIMTHATEEVARFGFFFFRVTGLLNPKSSGIGHFLSMILAVYLGRTGFFYLVAVCVFSESVF